MALKINKGTHSSFTLYVNNTNQNIYNHVMRVLIDEDCFLTLGAQSGDYYLMSENLIIHQIIKRSMFNTIKKINKTAFICNEENRWVIK